MKKLQKKISKRLSLSRPVRVGVLGGGQLSRMLALAGHELGLEVHVLSGSKDDPAAQVVRHWHKGNLESPSEVAQFASGLDVTTFESEFVESKVLKALVDLDRSGSSKKVFPSPSLMMSLQDRLLQKRLFDKYRLPTSPFAECHYPVDLDQTVKSLGDDLVFKKRLFGYDGYGTYFMKRSKNGFIWQKANEPTPQVSYLVEKRISFRRELAIQLVRNRDGMIEAFPLVETKQKEARCEWVKGPIQHAKLGRLLPKLKMFMKKIDYVGLMAFELFDSPEGVLVNEIAPRVHNSGHHSIDSLNCSQFTAHWLGVLNMPIPSLVPRTKGFAMMNILGELNQSEDQGQSESEGRAQSQSEGQVEFGHTDQAKTYWYGKAEIRKGRKLGHINALGRTPEDALKKAIRSRRRFYV